MALTQVWPFFFFSSLFIISKSSPSKMTWFFTITTSLDNFTTCIRWNAREWWASAGQARFPDHSYAYLWWPDPAHTDPTALSTAASAEKDWNFQFFTTKAKKKHIKANKNTCTIIIIYMIYIFSDMLYYKLLFNIYTHTYRTLISHAFCAEYLRLAMTCSRIFDGTDIRTTFQQ